MLIRPLFFPFGVDFFCFGKKFLVFNMISRNLKVKYRRSVFGFFWTLLGPVAMAAMYYFVFKIVLNVQIPHYLVFILSGILPWTFVSQSLFEATESIVGSWGLVSKVPIPVQIFSYVGTLTNLSTLMLAIPVMVGAAAFSGAPTNLPLAIVVLPVLFLFLFLMTYSMGLILSVSFVYLRDLKHVLGIFIQLCFYGTPILYEHSMVPEKYAWALDVNPLAPVFMSIHDVLMRGHLPQLKQQILIAGWAGALYLASALFYRKLGSGIVEKI